ncbi:MAG TPA: hypothetical protein VMH86_09805 [Rhizomicrobium sp.]|nr:hypothetical protein [Rhizomicrobium sp.]
MRHVGIATQTFLVSAKADAGAVFALRPAIRCGAVSLDQVGEVDPDAFKRGADSACLAAFAAKLGGALLTLEPLGISVSSRVVPEGVHLSALPAPVYPATTYETTAG